MLGEKNMAGQNKAKSFEVKYTNLSRHEKNIEERRKRQATALRSNLKKRKDQIRRRIVSS
tara:strand:- start:3598 stop:3777 length:180 start_codon:yes stop_codon:yes gene_type:complete